MQTTLYCDIYRSTRIDGMYLYVGRAEGLARVPEDLQRRFGRAEMAMSLALTPDKVLARARAADVMEAIRQEGYYLQMPPVRSVP